MLAGHRAGRLARAEARFRLASNAVFPHHKPVTGLPRRPEPQKHRCAHWQPHGPGLAEQRTQRPRSKEKAAMGHRRATVRQSSGNFFSHHLACMFVFERLRLAHPGFRLFRFHERLRGGHGSRHVCARRRAAQYAQHGNMRWWEAMHRQNLELSNPMSFVRRLRNKSSTTQAVRSAKASQDQGA